MAIPRRPFILRFLSRINQSETCWLWTGAPDRFGYGRISLGGRNAKALKAHRASWILFRGKIPEELCVCHKCDVKLCVNPEHLFLGTIADNNHDMFNKGRGNPGSPPGQQHWNSKLTDDEVLEIRKHSIDGTSKKHLAEKYDVDLSVIYRVIWRETRSHI